MNMCSILRCVALLAVSTPLFAQSVRLTEVKWGGVGCYKIEMPMGTVYFEKDNGVSGFKSFVDSEGKDWIASYMEPGPNGDFRGFPNSNGNFGHAGRDSKSTTTIVDGKTAGELVILELSNPDFTRRSGYSYHGYWAAKLLERDYPTWKAKHPTNATTKKSAL